MTMALSKALMSLTTCCLGESRREWAIAMQGEFEAAAEEGGPLAFAAGCLIAAWREMPRHQEGRLTMASYALALGVLIPMAAFQFACAIGFPFAPAGHGLLTMLAPGGARDPYLSTAEPSALPALLTLWLLLSIGHLRLAWVLVERDWSRAFHIGALIAAVTTTLFVFMGVLFLDAAPLLPQVAALAIELTAILAAARWHARLSLATSPQAPL
jgi:hypothetical protein